MATREGVKTTEFWAGLGGAIGLPVIALVGDLPEHQVGIAAWLIFAFVIGRPFGKIGEGLIRIGKAMQAEQAQLAAQRERRDADRQTRWIGELHTEPTREQRRQP
jgi:hypothetical protein